MTAHPPLRRKLRLAKDKAAEFNEELGRMDGTEISSGGLLLNENGGSSIELNTQGPSDLTGLVAHPTSSKVSINITGSAELMGRRIVSEGVSLLTLRTTKAGSVTIRLNADPDSSLNPSYVAVKGVVTQAPAALTVKIYGPYPSNPKVGQAVGFESSISEGRAPYIYSWDFGDGKILPYQNPVWYPERAGVFTVRLTVTDAQGRTGSASVTVVVSP